MEHTPWTYHIGEDYFAIYNSQDDKVLESPCLPETDSPLLKAVVQAVNSHDALVAALRASKIAMSFAHKTAEGADKAYFSGITSFIDAALNPTKEGAHKDHICPHCGEVCDNGLVICQHCGANRVRTATKEGK